MADVKISALPVALSIDSTDVAPMVHNGITVKATGAQITTAALNATPVTIAQGGTGSTTAPNARNNLGLGTMAVEAANNYVPITRTLTSGTGLSGGGDLSANRSFAIANTGVIATTYGSSTQIPVINVNAQGQITSASNTTISPAAINAAYFSAIQNGYTQLTAEIPNVGSTAPIQVTSTAGFASAGYIIINQEIISYTSITATSFGGTIVRGVFSTTKSSHPVGSYASEAAAAAVGTAKELLIDTIFLSNNITCTVPDSKVYFTNSGIYNIQLSVQILNYTTAIDNVTIWLRKNGTNFDYSAGVVEIPAKRGSTPGASINSWNYVDQYTAGQYFELVWTSATGESVIATFPPKTSPTRPASPSLILTVTQVG